ncbi:hypothetical protein BKA93DRAFT_813985, partial [Sparassis latifolia]
MLERVFEERSWHTDGVLRYLRGRAGALAISTEGAGRSCTGRVETMVVRWWSLRERANVAVRAELVVLYDARDDVGICQRELTCEGRSAWSIALANAALRADRESRNAAGRSRTGIIKYSLVLTISRRRPSSRLLTSPRCEDARAFCGPSDRRAHLD